MAGGNRAARRGTTAAELEAGIAQHEAGRPERAAALYRKVLAREPDNADALHLLGVVALGEGRAERAVQLIGRAVARAPGFALAYSNLGNAQRAAGRKQEAKASYLRAVALDPGLALAHNNLGRLLHEEGDFAAAFAACERAAALAPGLAEAQHNLGNALRELGRTAEAETAWRRAVALEPRNASRYSSLGNLLLEAGRFDEAEAAFRRAVALDPRHAPAHHGLATRLRLDGDMEGSIESCRAALAADPALPLVWNDLGRALRGLGRFEEAAGAFRRALALDPDFADAWRNLATCGKLPAGEAELARLENLAADPAFPVEERAAAGFAIGKALDDAERFDQAFNAYDRANRLYREARAAAGDRFDGDALGRRIDATIARYTPAFFAARDGRGSPSELPVFVVGMPRSGTSLVEQIAASHSLVFGAGELRDIGGLAAAIEAGAGEAEQQRLAEAHLQRLRTLGGEAARVIDKMPDNVFALGTVATLFPMARIVFCRRDPRDVCLSCYFQKFTAGQLTFSYDLADCARRYCETERLALYWRRVLPLRMIEIEYEKLVADLEGESRRLIAFLGLDWEPACLEFHRTERVVTTASGWQVRQPLYDRSAGRWRHYRRHLAPLFAALGVEEG